MSQANTDRRCVRVCSQRDSELTLALTHGRNVLVSIAPFTKSISVSVNTPSKFKWILDNLKVPMPASTLTLGMKGINASAKTNDTRQSFILKNFPMPYRNTLGELSIGVATLSKKFTEINITIRDIDFVQYE